jgi:hypothetical protein
MPVKSAKQFRFMQAAAHGSLKSKSKGKISSALAQEYLDKTSHEAKSKFAKAKRNK